jgi:hypothetical protein
MFQTINAVFMKYCKIRLYIQDHCLVHLCVHKHIHVRILPFLFQLKTFNPYHCVVNGLKAMFQTFNVKFWPENQSPISDVLFPDRIIRAQQGGVSCDVY